MRERHALSRDSFQQDEALQEFRQLAASRRKVEESKTLDALATFLLQASPASAAATKSLRIAVAGATGRVGQLVVKKLLEDGHSVKAVLRSASKAKEVLPNLEKIQSHVLDFSAASEEEFRDAFSDTDAVVWCASGFTDAGESLDIKGMTHLPAAFKNSQGDHKGPRIVMLSSAGVSRPAWSEDKKEKLIGASDIPIIRLNPGGILDRKREAESVLRTSEVPYCIVRPTGLKFGDDWPQGRPIFSQGDVAVGRTNAADLANVLSSAINEPDAVRKTFEMFTLVGYPPAADGIGRALAQLQSDASKSGPQLVESAVEATYSAMQQLLPGEEQDATKLEMGRTYEQVDSGEVKARQRGAAPTPREMELASRVGRASGSKRQAIKNFFSKIR